MLSISDKHCYGKLEGRNFQDAFHVMITTMTGILAATYVPVFSHEAQITGPECV
jgi:hypothetical protein